MENTYTDPTPAWEQIEIQKCAESFEYFCETYVKTIDSKKGLISFKLFPYHKRLVESMEGNRFLIGKKFRQGRFTTLTAIYALWIAMFQENKSLVFIAKTDEEGLRIGDIIKNSIHGFPIWLLPELSRNNQHYMKFVHTQSQISFLSPHAVRGHTVTHLFLDEPAFWVNAENLWNGIYPTISKEGKAVILSSVKKVKKKEKNWFRDSYKAAQEGRNEFVVFHVDYRECPDYDNEEWASEMQKQLGGELWKREVLCEFYEEEDEPQHKPTVNLADYNRSFRIYHRDQDKFVDIYSKYEKYESPERNEQGLKDLLARKGFSEVKKPYSDECKDTTNEDVICLNKNPINRDYAKRVLETHATIPPANPVTHPVFPECPPLEDDDIDELWKNIEEIMPGSKPELPKNSSGVSSQDDIPLDMLKLAGVVPTDTEEGDPAEYCVEWEDALLKRLSEGLPKELELSFGETLCVNGVPTKIQTRTIEMAFVGLSELGCFDKALDTVGKLVKKKLKVLF